MNRTKEQIETEIAELEDAIACAESDEEIDGETSFDLDSARCRLTDCRMELEGMN